MTSFEWSSIEWLSWWTLPPYADLTIIGDHFTTSAVLKQPRLQCGASVWNVARVLKGVGACSFWGIKKWRWWWILDGAQWVHVSITRNFSPLTWGRITVWWPWSDETDERKADKIKGRRGRIHLADYKLKKSRSQTIVGVETTTKAWVTSGFLPGFIHTHIVQRPWMWVCDTCS